MSRIVIAVVAIIVIITVGVLGELYIINSFNGIIDRLEQIKTLLDNKDYDAAFEAANAAISWWDKRRNVLELTCPHNEVKDFMSNLAQVASTIYAKNYQDALSLSISLQEDAKTRLGILRYLPKNIF